MARVTKKDLLELIAVMMWVCPISNSSDSCAYCGNMRHWGHSKDCEAARVLGIPHGTIDEE